MNSKTKTFLVFACVLISSVAAQETPVTAAPEEPQFIVRNNGAGTNIYLKDALFDGAITNAGTFRSWGTAYFNKIRTLVGGSNFDMLRAIEGGFYGPGFHLVVGEDFSFDDVLILGGDVAARFNQDGVSTPLAFYGKGSGLTNVNANNSQFDNEGALTIKNGAQVSNVTNLGTFTAFGTTVGARNFVVTTETPGANPTFYTTQSRQTTSGTSPTAATLVATLSDSTYLIEARIIARRTGGAAGSPGDSAAYMVRGCFKNVSGTVSIVGSLQTEFNAESQAIWDATLAIEGVNIQVQVSGAANNTITWHTTAFVTLINQ